MDSSKLTVSIDPRHVFYLSTFFYFTFSFLSIYFLEVIGTIYPIAGGVLHALLGFALLHENGKKYAKLIMEQFFLFTAVLVGGMLITSLVFFILAFTHYYEGRCLMGSLMHTVFAVLFSIIGYFFYKYSDSLKEEQFPETDMFSRQFTIHGFTLNMNTHRRAISLGAVLMNYVICLLILIFARPYGPITKLAAAFPFYYGTVYNGVLYVASRLPVKKRSLVAAAAFYNFILAVCLVITGIIFFITAFDYYYFRGENLAVAAISWLFAAGLFFASFFFYRYFWVLHLEQHGQSGIHYESNLKNAGEHLMHLNGTDKQPGVHWANGLSSEEEDIKKTALETAPRKIDDLI